MFGRYTLHLTVMSVSYTHLLMGASSILVQISWEGYETINLFFEGDYNNKNMFFDVSEIPDWVRELPITLIQESTYGDMDSDEITPCFKQNVLECLEHGGTVVAPVFSLGRSQEILYEVKCCLLYTSRCV